MESGILPVMAQILRRKSTLTTHTARLVAELARDGKNSFFLCTIIYVFGGVALLAGIVTKG